MSEAVPELEPYVDPEVLILDAGARDLLVGLVAEFLQEEPADRLGSPFAREIARRQVARHEGCRDLIGAAVRLRDDLVTGIDDVQDFVLNNVTLSEYGDLYVEAEDALRALRPRPSRPRPFLGPEHCSECGGWTHGEDCPVERRQEVLDERRPHEIASHRHCADILDELWAQTDALVLDIEDLALVIRQQAEADEYGTNRIPVPDVMPFISWRDRRAFALLNAPQSLAAELVPAPQVKTWCDDEHVHPHLGCRYQVS